MKLPDSSIVFNAREVQSAIDELAIDLQARCHGNQWIMLCVMQGGLMFTAELMKRMSVDLMQDSIRVTRYGDNTTGGELTWHYKPESELSGRRVIIVDDIFDEGETLAAIADYCHKEGAVEVVSAVLLEKNHDRKVDHYRPYFVGLQCDDRYVFGFGMDFEGHFRNLSEIRALASIH